MMRIVQHAIIHALALGVLAAALLNACGPIQYRAGRQFDPGQLERQLQAGVSRDADVHAILGEPYGQGRAMMPYHDSPRTVWSYFHDQSVIDLGNGKVDSRRQYLFVFFLGDRFDSYMWFNGELR
jgi:hypothetical protein